MMNFKLFLLGLILILSSCAVKPVPVGTSIYKTPTLEILKFSDHVYVHKSFLPTQDFGLVECNSAIFTDGGESVIIDTTSDDKSSQELINFVENQLNSKIKSVVVSHFHDDALGGISVFINKGIPTYALNKTLKIAAEKGIFDVPELGFDHSKKLNFGKSSLVAVYLGEGHTADNIVAYYTDEKVLFGGCLVKELEANQGFVGDANLNEWPKTLKNLKKHYGRANLVIPGHGEVGGPELIDYSLNLFKK